MGTSDSRAPKGTLNQERLDRFLALLDSDREKAGQEYEKLRQKLMRFFECRRCRDAEDWVDLVIDRTARRACEEEIEHPQSYTFGVARHLLQEIARDRGQQPISLEDLGPAPPLADPSTGLRNDDDEEPEELREKRLECLKQCLRRFRDPKAGELIVEYYYGQKGVKIQHRKKLARGLGITVEALRVRAHRIRAQLEEWVKSCMEH